MFWLVPLWFFVRFVDKENTKLHENIRSAEMRRFKDDAVIGEVNMDNAITTYASKRHAYRFFRKLSEGRVQKIAVDAITVGYFRPTKSRRAHRESLIITEKGYKFSKSVFGISEALYTLYPKTVAFVLTGGAFAVIYSTYHLVAKIAAQLVKFLS